MRSYRTLYLIFVVLTVANIAEAQTCLHEGNQNQQQSERVQAVVMALRTLNTAEARYFSQNKKFATYDELSASPALADSFPKDAALMKFVSFRPNTDVVPGFEMRLTTNGTTYNISVLDKVDACRFSLFSSDVGIIYGAYPLQ